MFVLLMMIGSAFAAPEAVTTVGRVVKTVGEAWVSVGTAEKTKLLNNNTVPEHSVISTGPNSSAFILLNDRSIVKVGADSKLEMNYAAKDAEHVNLNLL